MRLIEQPRGKVLVAEAPIWDDQADTRGRDHLLVGLVERAIQKKAGRAQSWQLGQLYGCVCPGLIFTRYLYRGLRRDMMVGDDQHADRKKLIATWRQPRDAQFVGGPTDGRIVYCEAPSERVFTVYISRNEMLEEFPDIYGWAEHWCWIPEDPEREGAPVQWKTRYDSPIWAAVDA